MKKMKPIIKTSLCISGEGLNFDEITSTLGVSPEKTRRREDYPEISKEMGYAHDEWVYSTGKNECRAISLQLDSLEDAFSESAEKIRQLCERYRAEVTVVIVIEMDAGEHPELCLSRKNVQFLSSINAELGIDPYIG